MGPSTWDGNVQDMDCVSVHNVMCERQKFCNTDGGKIDGGTFNFVGVFIHDITGEPVPSGIVAKKS